MVHFMFHTQENLIVLAHHYLHTPQWRMLQSLPCTYDSVYVPYTREYDACAYLLSLVVLLHHDLHTSQWRMLQSLHCTFPTTKCELILILLYT